MLMCKEVGTYDVPQDRVPHLEEGHKAERALARKKGVEGLRKLVWCGPLLCAERVDLVVESWIHAR